MNHLNFMKRLYFKGTSNLRTEDSEEREQEFYLVEYLKDGKRNTYGIKIIKRKEDYIVEEDSDPISYSKDYVEDLIHRFMEREVYVTSLNEILEDTII